MNQALQSGNPKGRVDLLVVRLLESVIKARYGAPAESTLSIDLLHVGETLARRVGLSGLGSLRFQLEKLAMECGVSTDQTLPELARNLGLLRGPRAGVKCRRAACTR